MNSIDMYDTITRIEDSQKKAAYILQKLIEDYRFDMIGEAVEEFCKVYRPYVHDEIGTGLQIVFDYLIHLEETIKELRKKTEEVE